MKRIFLGEGDMPLTEYNAQREFDSMDEAREFLGDVRAEFLNGVYDANYDIHTKDERLQCADELFIYVMEFTNSGAVRKAYEAFRF